MVKRSKKEKEKSKENSFKKFIKNRAPIYLSIIAILIIFVIPELTKGTLQTSMPDNLTDEEKHVVNTLMAYNGPNKKGLNVMDAISNEIDKQYPNEKIYDNKETTINVSVSKLNNQNYQVIFDFKSYKGDLKYNWNIDMQSGDVKGNDEDSKYIINLVDFYD